MMSSRRITGISGILWCLLSLLALLTITTTDLSEAAMEAGDVHTILTAMADNPRGSAAAFYLFLASIVFAAGFGVGIAGLLSEEHAWLHFARATMAIGATVFLMETIVSISLVQSAAAAYASSAPSEQKLLQVPLRALMQFRNNGAWLGSTLFTVAALMFGAATLCSTRRFPRWPACLVTASGLAGIAGTLTPFFPVFSTVRQIGLTGFSLWALIVGLMLLRRDGEAKSPAPG